MTCRLKLSLQSLDKVLTRDFLIARSFNFCITQLNPVGGGGGRVVYSPRSVLKIKALVYSP